MHYQINGTEYSVETILTTLKSGKSIEINNHYVIFEDGLIWYTNPYGQDGTLGNKLDVELVNGFLSDMANDIVCGQVP